MMIVGSEQLVPRLLLVSRLAGWSAVDDRCCCCPTSGRQRDAAPTAHSLISSDKCGTISQNSILYFKRSTYTHINTVWRGRVEVGVDTIRYQLKTSTLTLTPAVLSGGEGWSRHCLRLAGTHHSRRWSGWPAVD